MADRMTFREAVEIVRHGFDGYVLVELRTNENASQDDLVAKWDRARLIVEAAVEAHELRVSNSGFPYDEATVAAYYKLRALERGESEVQS